MLARTLVITISALAASRAHEACENGGTECADVWDVQGMLQLASPASAPAAGFPKRKGTKKKHPKHSTPTPISKKKFTPEVWAPIHEAVRAPVQLTCEAWGVKNGDTPLIILSAVFLTRGRFYTRKSSEPIHSVFSCSKLISFLGPPAMPFLTPFLGQGSPTKIDYRKKEHIGTNLF